MSPTQIRSFLGNGDRTLCRCRPARESGIGGIGFVRGAGHARRIQHRFRAQRAKMAGGSFDDRAIARHRAGAPSAAC